jgi:fused signal recognition particle receptor
MGLWKRFRQGLEKTRSALRTDIRDLFKSEGRLVDEQFLDELFGILVRTDMGGGPASEIQERIEREFRGRVVQMDEVLEQIRDELRKLMQQPEVPIEMATEGPTVIMVVGVNGSGKTTSIAKLAHLFKSEGKSVVLGAADTFRAAAVEQLTIWSERIGVKIVKGDQGADPASVAHRAVAEAVREKADICIVDTAGRL